MVPSLETPVLVQAAHRPDVLLITLNRPHKRNAVDQATAEALDAAMHRLEHEEGVRAGILTGAGGMFSAGTDLTCTTPPGTAAGGGYGLVRRARTRPLIAAVEGLALGGGMEIALACDLVVAGRDAQFALPEATRGLLANCGALFRGAEKLPTNLALELLLTGDRLAAPRAHELGFVNRLSDTGEALQEAVALAEAVCRSGPDAVATAMTAIGKARTVREEPLWTLTEQAVTTTTAGAEVREGVAAFFERREPAWRQR